MEPIIYISLFILLLTYLWALFKILGYFFRSKIVANKALKIFLSCIIFLLIIFPFLFVGIFIEQDAHRKSFNHDDLKASIYFWFTVSWAFFIMIVGIILKRRETKEE
jgi:hypothetical protein